MVFTQRLSALLYKLVAPLREPEQQNPTESDLRYQHLIETSPAPINLFDATGTIVWGNDATVELVGLASCTDLTGRSIFEFIKPDDRYTAEQELLTVVEEKQPTGPTEMQLERADGSTREIRVSTAPGRYKGRDIGQAVIIDVTQLNELQNTIDAERQFINRALNTVQDVFYVLNPNGKLERWNDTLLTVSGYNEHEVQAMEVEEFFVEADIERVSESIATAFTTGEAVVEATVVTKAGRTLPYEFRKRRLVIDDTVHGVVGVGRDISDRRAQYQHLRAVDRVMQHNLRNKVNVITASLDQLREGAREDASDAIDRIERSAETLISIFDHHRNIVQMFTEEPAGDEFDVVSVVEATARETQETYPEAEITVRAPPEATVVAVSELPRAIHELVENAITHNPQASPSVDISVTTNDGFVSIAVADTGPPIPAFEKHVVTGTAETTPTAHSQSLGLWFVHWVAERSGGELSFNNNTPKGNIVTIELESAQPDEP